MSRGSGIHRDCHNSECQCSATRKWARREIRANRPMIPCAAIVSRTAHRVQRNSWNSPRAIEELSLSWRRDHQSKRNSSTCRTRTLSSRETPCRYRSCPRPVADRFSTWSRQRVKKPNTKIVTQAWLDCERARAYPSMMATIVSALAQRRNKQCEAWLTSPGTSPKKSSPAIRANYLTIRDRPPLRRKLCSESHYCLPSSSAIW